MELKTALRLVGCAITKIENYHQNYIHHAKTLYKFDHRYNQSSIVWWNNSIYKACMQVGVILRYVSAAATFNVETFTAGSFDAIAFRFRITICQSCTIHQSGNQICHSNYILNGPHHMTNDDDKFFVNTKWKVTRSSHLGTVCYCIIQIQRFVSFFDCLVLSWSVHCSRCFWISCLVMYLFCACIVVLFIRQIYNQETSTIIANLKIISRSTTRNPPEIQKSFRPVFSIWDSGPIRLKKNSPGLRTRLSVLTTLLRRSPISKSTTVKHIDHQTRRSHNTKNTRPSSDQVRQHQKFSFDTNATNSIHFIAILRFQGTPTDSGLVIAWNRVV